jgi:hypothetical protein
MEYDSHSNTEAFEKAVCYSNNLSQEYTKCSVLNMYIHQVTEKSEYFQKPDDYYNYNYKVEYFFERALHRDITIYNPEDNTSCNYYE